MVNIKDCLEKLNEYGSLRIKGAEQARVVACLLSRGCAKIVLVVWENKGEGEGRGRGDHGTMLGIKWIFIF